MIVADTGAIIALVDADDKHHRAVRALFENDPESWLLPWAVLPEVDYLLSAHVGTRAEEAFLADLGAGIYHIEWGKDEDLERAQDLATRYQGLKLGLVDGAVIAVAERLRAGAIATLDLRHFGAVSIKGRPRLLPRDLS